MGQHFNVVLVQVILSIYYGNAPISRDRHFVPKKSACPELACGNVGP
jgi:hypothetical protein